MEIQVIQSKIYEIRGQRVMLDRDLAELYQVTTSALNQAVKRNSKRFPPDFMFQLTNQEFGKLEITNCDIKLGRYSQNAVCLYGAGSGNVIRFA